MRSMLKSELARAAGVSTRTFSRWLAKDSQLMRKHGITKHSHIIPPKAVRFLCHYYGIDL